MATSSLAHGLRDAARQYMTGPHPFSLRFRGVSSTALHAVLSRRGVWLSGAPLDYNESAKGGELVALFMDISDNNADEYEWVGDGKGYREWQFGSGRRLFWSESTFHL